MNERIQNLKDKIWEERYWTNPNTDRLLPAQLNRFAESIIRECADIALQEDHDPSNCILKHFGVERSVSKCDTCDCMYPCRSSRNDKPWD